METLEQQRADVKKSGKLRITGKSIEQFLFHAFIQQIFKYLVCYGAVLVSKDTAKNII